MAFTVHCLIPVFSEQMHRAYAIVSALTLDYCTPLLRLNMLANPSPSYRPAPGSMPFPLGGDMAIHPHDALMWPSWRLCWRHGYSRMLRLV